MKILIRPRKNTLKFTKYLGKPNFHFISTFGTYLNILWRIGCPMFKEAVSPIFLFNSSSFYFSLLPTSLDENNLSRGVNLLGMLLSSMDIVFLGLKGLF
jgi:hypothetical protein